MEIIPIVITVIAFGLIVWAIISRSQNATASATSPTAPTPAGTPPAPPRTSIVTGTRSWFGANWKFLVVVGLSVWCFKSCSDSSKVAAEAQARAVIAEQNKPKPEILLMAYPNRVSEPALIWEKFGSYGEYHIIRHGSVWAYPDGRKDNPVLLTPNNMEVLVGAKWNIAFRSAESGPVEVILRQK